MANRARGEHEDFVDGGEGWYLCYRNTSRNTRLPHVHLHACLESGEAASCVQRLYFEKPPSFRTGEESGSFGFDWSGGQGSRTPSGEGRRHCLQVCISTSVSGARRTSTVPVPLIHSARRSDVIITSPALFPINGASVRFTSAPPRPTRAVPGTASIRDCHSEGQKERACTHILESLLRSQDGSERLDEVDMFPMRASDLKDFGAGYPRYELASMDQVQSQADL